MLIALHYLKAHNPLYADIEINENWIQTWHEEDKQLYDGIFDTEQNDTDSRFRKYMDTSEEKKTPQISHNGEILSANCSDSDESDSAKMENHGSDEDEKDMIALEENYKLQDLPYDSCLQSEIPKQANQIFLIAPGEGSKPLPLLPDKLFEELAKPEKFPNGKGGFEDTQRHTTLTFRK